MNDKGKYLQACVWYMILFDAKASDIKFAYTPKNPKANVKLLIECAEEAVKQLKK